MKRHLYGFLFFLLIVNASFLIFHYIHVSKQPVILTQPMLTPRTELVQDFSDDRSGQIKSEFIPEFTDLPSFEEIIEEDNIFENDAQYNAPDNLINYIDFYDPKYSASVFNKDSLRVRNGDTWLAFFEYGRNTYLKKTKIKTRSESKHEGLNSASYISIKLDIPEKPLFLVRGLKNVKEGDITTSFSMFNGHTTENLKVGYRRDFFLGQTDYVLRVSNGLLTNGDKVNVLVLESPSGKHIVTYNHYLNDPSSLYDTIGDLLWIGDMDNDNKPDLYINNFGFEKGGIQTSLFLSSEAPHDNAVKLVASFTDGGC